MSSLGLNSIRCTVGESGFLFQYPSLLPTNRSPADNTRVRAFSWRSQGFYFEWQSYRGWIYREPNPWSCMRSGRGLWGRLRGYGGQRATWQEAIKLWPTDCTALSCWKSESSSCRASSRSGEQVWPTLRASCCFIGRRPANQVMNSYRFNLWGLASSLSACLSSFRSSCWIFKALGKAR